jgi:hypothetical protein
MCLFLIITGQTKYLKISVALVKEKTLIGKRDAASEQLFSEIIFERRLNQE